jgi:hypothetical protein
MPVSLGGFSKAKRLMLLTSDSDKLQTIRTTKTVIPCNSPLGELLMTRRSMERMAVMLLPERHLFTHNRMEACRFSPRPEWKVKQL